MSTVFQDLSYSERQFDDLNLYPYLRGVLFSKNIFLRIVCFFVLEKLSKSQSADVILYVRFLSSMLLRLGVGVNFKPRKRTLAGYLNNFLLDKLNMIGLTICVLAFLSSSWFDISNQDEVKTFKIFDKASGGLTFKIKENTVLESGNFILKNNTLTSDSEFYLQIKGTAIGTIFAPTYANLTMRYQELKFTLLSNRVTL